jgi:uncharacterized membrane protein YdjX (TVP38/TMEM64 family)
MKKLFSKDTFKFSVLIAVVIAIIVLSIHFDLKDKVSVTSIKDFVEGMGVFGPIVFILIYVLTSMIMFPASLLSTASGLIWGKYLGTFYTVIAASIASIIPFYIARFMGRGFTEKLFRKYRVMDVCDRFAGKQGFLTVLVMRLLPFLPWNMVNYGSGLCSIRFRDYILATVIGTIPASFTYNLIGSSIGKPIDKGMILIVTAIAVLMGTLFFILKKYKKRS